MASAPISKLEYLKKYMSSAQTVEKKHKKKKLKQVLKAKSNVTIIDTDVDLKRIKSEAFDEEDENAPQIVAVISDHDKELQRKRWRTVGASEDKVTIKQEPSSPVSDHYDEQHLKRSRNSPVRRRRHDSGSGSDHSPIRTRHDSPSDSDHSPLRRRHDSASNSDRSPVRKTRQDSGSDSDRSPVRRKRPDSGSDSDRSPVRKQQPKSSNSSRKRRDSDSDASPPRKRSNNEEGASRNGLKQRTEENSDASPRPSRRTVDADGDLSLVRKSTSALIPPHKIKKEKMDKTLDGKKAGLQSARDLRKETDALRQREDEAFKQLSGNLSGRGAETVHRDRATGKRRNLEAEREADREKEERKQKLLEKFQEWGKGLKQSQAQEQRLQDDLHEMSKPLARMAGDEDLESYLKAQDREGDPMAAYMAKKKKKQEVSIPGRPSRPTYQGPDGPPNRFNISPGYRWDGVDRSNGFEKQRFMKQTKKVAVAEEAYKWSVADM